MDFKKEITATLYMIQVHVDDGYTAAQNKPTESVARNGSQEGGDKNENLEGKTAKVMKSAKKERKSAVVVF